MKKKLNILLTTLIFTLLSFHSKGFTQNAQKKVFLYNDKNDTLVNFITLEKFQNEFFDNTFLEKSRKHHNDLNFIFDLSSPRLFKLTGLSPQTAPIVILITPGDSINYKIDANNIVFDGKNSSNYNFFNKLNTLNLQYPTYSVKNGIEKFNQQTKSVYNKKILFFKQYIKKNKVSNEFKYKIRSVLEFQYINWLFNRFIIPKEQLIKQSKYIKEINLKTFDQNNNEDNAFYYLALTNFLYCKSITNSESDLYSIDRFNYQIKLINENLSGDVREYAIVKTIFDYDEHIKYNNITLILKTIDMNLLKIKNKSYKDVLEQIKLRLTKLNSQIPEEVLNANLKDLNGDTIAFKEILKQQGNKIKIIDFWASWCAPCIEEIKKSYSFRETLINEKKVVFLYFSIDKDSEKWKNKITELKHLGMVKNQFITDESTNNLITNYFNTKSIPRYIILDQNNKVYLNNAPSPSDSKQFSTIINDISIQK